MSGERRNAAPKPRAERGKRLMRAILERYFPRSQFERPKMGLAVLIDHWVDGPLSKRAERLLNPVKVRSKCAFCIENIRRAWFEHLDGRHLNQFPLWAILTFQVGLEHRHAR